MPKTKSVTPTTSESMGSPSNSITNSTQANRAAAQSAYEAMKNSPVGSPLTITIKQEKFADYSVITVTTDSSDGIQTQTFSDEWLNTLKGKPDGSPRKRNRAA